MNKYFKILICFLSLSLIQNISKAQTTTIIDYSNWSTNQCNAFYPMSPTINN